MNDIYVFIVLQAIASGGLSAFVAGEKNRDRIGWFLTGFICSFFALIALAGLASCDNGKDDELPGVLK